MIIDSVAFARIRGLRRTALALAILRFGFGFLAMGIQTPEPAQSQTTDTVSVGAKTVPATVNAYGRRNISAYGFVKSRSASVPNPSNALWSGGSGSTIAPMCAPPAPAPLITYQAYIPFDHVTGSDSLGCTIQNLAPSALYVGDNPQNGRQVTYRTSLSANMYEYGNPSYVYADNGITYQFANSSSPVSPPWITSGDYDGIFNDCYIENQEGQAQYGFWPNYYYAYTSGGADWGTLTYVGAVSNPLSIPLLLIGWNVTTTLTGLGSWYGYVSVSGDVTCFPASQILLLGDGVVASYVPTSSNPLYVGACLALPATTPLTGPATAPGGEFVGFYYH